MNELDLKEIIWYLLDRIQHLETKMELPYSDYQKRSDEYIQDVLNSIKEGE
jgi:glucose-6-phosphate isomerase